MPPTYSKKFYPTVTVIELCWNQEGVYVYMRIGIQTHIAKEKFYLENSSEMDLRNKQLLQMSSWKEPSLH